MAEDRALLDWYEEQIGQLEALADQKRRRLAELAEGAQPDREEQIVALLRLQDGRCAICARPLRQPIILDHDHATGATRGLLCLSCNPREGMGVTSVAFTTYRTHPPAAGLGWRYQDRWGRRAEPEPDYVALVARQNDSNYYAHDLGLWSDWCAANGVTVLKATPEAVERWMLALSDAGAAPRTVNRRLNGIAAFYERAVDRGLVEIPPTRNVRRLPAEAKPRPLLSEDDRERLLHAAQESGTRDEAVVRLLVAGCLAEDVAQQLTTQEQTLSRHGVFRICRRLGRRAGIETPVFPYAVRASRRS